MSTSKSKAQKALRNSSDGRAQRIAFDLLPRSGYYTREAGNHSREAAIKGSGAQRRSYYPRSERDSFIVEGVQRVKFMLMTLQFVFVGIVAREARCGRVRNWMAGRAGERVK